ncbi:MAG: PIN domain-containing protein [Bacillota bacterium]|nr:PIN domain-containing protein [Bacillota bacterium]
MNKAVFIDTSAWIMLLNKSEGFHEDASSIYNDMLESVFPVTSNMVIGETYTWLRKKVGFAPAFSYLSALDRKERLRQIAVMYSDAILEKEAVNILAQFKDQSFSFADAVSFALMQKKGIRKAFAYDRHFVVAGFELINRL